METIGVVIGHMVVL